MYSLYWPIGSLSFIDEDMSLINNRPNVTAPLDTVKESQNTEENVTIHFQALEALLKGSGHSSRASLLENPQEATQSSKRVQERYTGQPFSKDFDKFQRNFKRIFMRQIDDRRL